MNTTRYFDGSPASPTQQKLDELMEDIKERIQSLSYQDKRQIIAAIVQREKLLSRF